MLGTYRGRDSENLGKKGSAALRKPRGPKPTYIELTERQRALLEQIVRRATSPQRLVVRSKILLKAADGKRNQEIADELEITVRTPRRWRDRWAQASAHLTAAETEVTDAQLSELIEALLTDKRHVFILSRIALSRLKSLLSKMASSLPAATKKLRGSSYTWLIWRNEAEVSSSTETGR